MPATAVGRQKGSSITPSKILFPGKSYRTKTQASMMPKKQLISAAIKEQVMLVAKAKSTFSLVKSLANCAGESLREYKSTDTRGIRIRTESISTVIPRDRPKPGITRSDRLSFIFIFLFAIDLIKNTTILEELFICTVPAAEVIDGAKVNIQIKLVFKLL